MKKEYLQTVKAEKQSLRRRIKSITNRFPEDRLRKEQVVIEKRVEELPDYKDAQVIMFYWPFGREVDTRNLIRKAKKNKKKIGLPVIFKQENIQPYEYTEESNLTQNFLGFEEPNPDATPKIEIQELDLVIVPGLAFDGNNHRLGRGKGYYDRFLKTVSCRTKKIGVAFSFQKLKSLPFDPLTDQKVDRVISS